MRFLITGGAGTLGSNIIEKLIKNPSNQIICIDNFETGTRSNIKFLKDELIVNGSICDREKMEELYVKLKPDVVIHSAASYKDPNNFYGDAKTNILGAINIGYLSKKYNVSKVINFQTALCYGIPKKIPIPIDHDTNPFTSYGISKTFAENYLKSMKIPFVSLRLANICSKNLSIGPIPTFYKRLKQGKECFCVDTKRDFLDFEDFYRLLYKVVFKSNIFGVYNVSTGKGKSILDIYNEILNYLKIDVKKPEVKKISSDDIPKIILDPSETIKKFNWKAEVTFEKMIINQLKHYDKHGIQNIYSHLK